MARIPLPWPEAFERPDGGTEGLSPHFETGELVEGRARRRQQHGSPLAALGQCVSARIGDRLFHGCADYRIDPAGERAGKVFGRLADQIRPHDLAEIRRQLLDTPGLGPAAGDPVDRVESRQGAGRGVDIGGLGIVDERHWPDPAHLLHAVGKPGKACHRRGDRAGIEADGASRGVGGTGVLPVVPAAQGPHGLEVDFLDRFAGAALVQHAVGRAHAVLEHPLHRDRHHVGPVEPPCNRLAPGIVDAHDGGIARPLAREHPRFDRCIGLHRAVPVEMVGRQVEQRADLRLEAGHQVDLVGRQLEHIDPPRQRRRQQKGRGADVAADLGIAPGRPQHVAGKRGGGRLAVGAGDRDDLGPGAVHLAGEHLGVADDLDACRTGAAHRPVRRRDG
jgi:hypothetical protein